MIQKVLERLPLAMLINGKRRSGKTHLLIKMLNSKYFKKKFDRIYIFSPTITLDKSWEDVKNKNALFYDVYDENTIEMILRLQKRTPEEERKHVLIILDDLAEKLKGKRGNVLEQLATKGRHFKVSFIFTTQKYNATPTVIRNNADEIIFFRISNNFELKTVLEEYSNKDFNFEDLLDYATDDYNYLLIVKGKKDNFYKGNLLTFKKITID